MASTPEPEPVEGDSIPEKPIRKIWFVIGWLGIALLTGLIVWSFFSGHLNIRSGAGNAAPQIVYFSPTYGSIGPADTNEVVVLVADEELPRDLNFKWEVSEGVFGPTERPYVITYRAPIAPGSYYVFVTVTVTDSWGARSTATTRILVSNTGY